MMVDLAQPPLQGEGQQQQSDAQYIKTVSFRPAEAEKMKGSGPESDPGIEPGRSPEHDQGGDGLHEFYGPRHLWITKVQGVYPRRDQPFCNQKGPGEQIGYQPCSSQKKEEKAHLCPG